MDYDLSRIGPHLFEQMVQSLAVRVLGPQISVFGMGPDGGREASWEGVLSTSLVPAEWDGYGVFQAKYMHNAKESKANAQWLKKQIKDELAQWLKPNSKRGRQPTFYLVATNVRLSPGPNGGIESVHREVMNFIRQKGMEVQGLHIWRYDEIRSMLEDATDIRTAYEAWITPGDILKRIMDSLDSEETELVDALQAYTAKCLRDDVRLNLTQAGSMTDAPVGIADVFIELPAVASEVDLIVSHSVNAIDDDISIDDEDYYEGVDEAVGITAELLATGDQKQSQSDIGHSDPQGRQGRNVLIGGPGQGKSTIGQFLCQIYRARFLADSQVEKSNGPIREIIQQLQQHSLSIGIDLPVARRWPFKITLTDLADHLDSNPTSNALSYIAERVKQRTDFPVTTAMLRRWLRRYPWFLLLDGLDEVPATSNRDQVLETIHDLLLDIDSIGADVLVVATTRPQGYNDDFDPRFFRHYELLALPKERALAVADRLIGLRLGADSDRAGRVKARLHRAAKEEATSRLLSTPLQTTILTLLIERLGQAPKDRWRLFSQYYRVIYQREQEKGGPLADLLRDYESDINAIHYEAALSLQNRGASAGGARSVLTKELFSKLILGRLLKQGHDEKSAEGLVRRFETLATDRLVFLAALRDNAYGFEIRSLQEFMAGEALLFRPEVEVPDILRSIATSSYWRNTLLFAIGKIFAERESLRGSIIALCVDLNLDRPAHRASRPGSLLALDIISDGVCRTQPAYTRPLAKCSLELLDGAPINAVDELAELDKYGAGEQLDQQLLRAMSIRKTSSLLCTARVLSKRYEDSHNSTYLKQLKFIIDLMDQQQKSQLAELASSIRAIPILTCLAGKALDMSPALFRPQWHAMELLPGRRFAHLEDPEGRVPAWLATVVEGSTANAYTSSGNIPIASSASSPLSTHPDDEKSALSTAFASLSEPRLNWRNLLSIPDVPRSNPWHAVKQIAYFGEEPGSGTLSAALESLADHANHLSGLAGMAPWPLAACFASVQAQKSVRTTPSAQCEVFRRLAVAAENGELGTYAEWSAAEERWSNGITLDEVLGTERSLPSGEYSPFTKSIAEHGAILAGSAFMASHARGLDAYEKYAQIRRRAFEVSLSLGERKVEPGVIHLASFLTHILSNIKNRDDLNMPQEVEISSEHDSFIAEMAPDRLREFLELSMQIANCSAYLREIPEVRIRNGEVDALLYWTGCHFADTFIRKNRSLAKYALSKWRVSSNAWPLGRLTFHSLRKSDVTGQAVLQVEDMEDPVQRRLYLYVQLLRGEPTGGNLSAWASEAAKYLIDPLLGDAGQSTEPRDPINALTLVQMLDGSRSSGDSVPFALLLDAIVDQYPTIASPVVEELVRVVSSSRDGRAVPWQPIAP